MKPYAERAVFNDMECDVYQATVAAVEKVKHIQRGKEIRCHELARAIFTVLIGQFCVLGWEPVLVDGKWKSVDHTWITWRWEAAAGTTILDVYTPGALPQVQLLDASGLTRRMGDYVPSPFKRTDIRKEVVDELVRTINDGPTCTCSYDDSEEMTGHAALCALVKLGIV